MQLTQTTPTPAPPAPSGARQRWAALAVLATIEFMILLDASIVNIALPAIKTSLHFTEADLSWVQNAYLLVFGGVLLFGGRVADLFGRRRFYLIGLGLFTASSLLAGIAPTGAILLAARALQGVGAALVLPAEQSLLVTIFTDKDEFNRAMGIWGAMAAAGGILGILFGGLLTQFVGWPWIFLINIPVGALALVFSPRLLPESRAEGAGRRLDIAGALSVTLALVGFAYAPIAGQRWGWASFQAVGTLGGAVVLLLAFLAIEARAASPLVPLRLFRLRDANGANIASFLVGAAHAPMFYLLSLYFQQALGWSALSAGLAILPVGVASLLVSFLLIPRALGHLGPRGVLAGGMALLAVGLLLLARAPVPSDYALDILPALLLVSVGLPAAFVGTNFLAVTAVAPEETGLASGLMNTAQRVGGGIGIAALTAIFVAQAGSMGAHTAAPALAGAFHVAFFGAALLAIAGVVVTLAVIRRSSGQVDKASGPRAFHFHH
jgi:EmrB/QacA subfamily drug resistance transporter